MLVELDNTCEGMIRLSELTDDYYIFDEQNFTLTGTDFGREYRLGQKVRIKVVGADRLEKTVDFSIVDEDTDPDDIQIKPEKKHYVLKLMEEEARQKEQAAQNKESRVKEGKSKLHEDTLSGIDFSDGEDDDFMTGAELFAHERKKRLIDELEPDARTGKPREKKRSSKNKSSQSKVSKEKLASKGRKKYKVHKYKKSATSKAARRNQNKK